MATRAVAAQHAAGRFVPGLGHPVHKAGDPRTPASYDHVDRCTDYQQQPPPR